MATVADFGALVIFALPTVVAAATVEVTEWAIGLALAGASAIGAVNRSVAITIVVAR